MAARRQRRRPPLHVIPRSTHENETPTRPCQRDEADSTDVQSPSSRAKAGRSSPLDVRTRLKPNPNIMSNKHDQSSRQAAGPDIKCVRCRPPELSVRCSDWDRGIRTADAYHNRDHLYVGWILLFSLPLNGKMYTKREALRCISNTVKYSNATSCRMKDT